ncbi:hypothetical protein Tco_0418637 [Tanacetum coccineum]
MKGYIDSLEHLGHLMSSVPAVNTVLGSLTKSFNNFVVRYNMNSYDKYVDELHVMLKNAEKYVSSKNVVLSLHMIREGNVRKNNKSYSKGEGRSKGRKKISPIPKKRDPHKECIVLSVWKDWTLEEEFSFLLG